MSVTMKKFLSNFVRRAKDEDGNATVEFVFVIPVFLLLFVSIFEVAFTTIRLTVLEFGLDVTMRDIRLSTGEEFSHEVIRNRVCENAGFLRDCNTNMQIEMVVVDTTAWNLPDPLATCVDRSEGAADPVITFSNGQQNDLMFIRACYVVKPLFPTFGLGAILETDASGRMQLVAKSAFAQEPT